MVKSDGLTHRMIVPMTNIVIAWETILKAIGKERKRFHLRLVKSALDPGIKNLAGIYELQYTDDASMFHMEIVQKETELQMEDEMPAHLQLQSKVFHNSGESKLRAVFRARQPYHGWYRIERTFKLPKNGKSSYERSSKGPPKGPPKLDFSRRADLL